MTAELRNNIGPIFTVKTTTPIPNAAYAVAGDKLTIDNTVNKALSVDFEVDGAAFSAAPTGGSITLVAVDWSLDGTTPGPVPSAGVLGREVGSFSPTPAASNTSTGWSMSLSSVDLGNKVDFYLFNHATGQCLAAGAVLKAQCWSRG